MLYLCFIDTIDCIQAAWIPDTMQRHDHAKTLYILVIVLP